MAQAVPSGILPGVQHLREVGLFRILTTPIGPQRIGCWSLAETPAALAPGRSMIDVHADRYSLNFIQAGNGLYLDDQGREHPFGPGCFIQRFPGRRHSTRLVASDYRESFLFLREPLLGHLRTLGVLPAPLPVIVGKADPRTPATYAALQQALAGHGPDTWSRVLSCLLAVFACTRRTEVADEPGLCAAVNAILADPERRHGLDELAAIADMPVNTFRKAFVRRMGLPPLSWQQRMRFEQACLLLEDLPVKCVARRLGYHDDRAFAKRFRRVLGRPPGDFRRDVAHRPRLAP